MTRARLPAFRLDAEREQALRERLPGVDVEAFLVRVHHVLPLHLAAFAETRGRRGRRHAALAAIDTHAAGLLAAIDPLPAAARDAIARHLARGETPEDLAWPLVDRLRTLSAVARRALADGDGAAGDDRAALAAALLPDLVRIHAECGGDATDPSALQAVAHLLADACATAPG